MIKIEREEIIEEPKNGNLGLKLIIDEETTEIVVWNPDYGHRWGVFIDNKSHAKKVAKILNAL